MRVFLTVLALISLVASLGTCVGGKTSINEIQGMILLVVAAVFFVGAAIVEAVNTARATIEKKLEGQRPSP